MARRTARVEACRAAVYRRARPDGEVTAVVSSPDGRRERGTHRGARLLRGARRRAVRHGRRAARRLPRRRAAAPPDRATASLLATRRTAVLNRAWRSCATHCAACTTTASSNAARPRRWIGHWKWTRHRSRARRRVPRAAQPASRWHQPQWRNVAGFQVPAEVFMAGPGAQNDWIVANHIAGEDWRTHSERYWLRYAAGYYRDRGASRGLDRHARAAGRPGRRIRHAGAGGPAGCLCRHRDVPAGDRRPARGRRTLCPQQQPAPMGGSRAARAAGRVPGPARPARHRRGPGRGRRACC